MPQQLDNNNMHTFDIDEPIQEALFDSESSPKLRAFTHSSSWVGNVRYDSEEKTMRILMNGKAYNHCGVEMRDYDAFEGSPSKGEHWWRNIKDRFDCGGFSEATNNAADMDWPPCKYDQRDTVDVLMFNYSPDTGRPDGISPDELSLATEPQPTGKPYTYPNVTEIAPGEACGNCKFFVDGGACALVKGAIDPINGICKFYTGGQTLPFNTQVFPIYEQVEAEYKVMSYEPYLRETTIIDRKHQLEADGIPENEIDTILQKEFGDTSIIEETIQEDQKIPYDTQSEFSYLEIDKIPKDDQQHRNYVATGSKLNSEPSMHGEHGHQVTNPEVMDYKNENPDPDALLYDLPPLYQRTHETRLIRETIGELSTQFNWMTPDYLQRVTQLGKNVGGRFVLVRASAEAVTDHRAEGEPYRRLLKGDELAQLTRTGIGKSTDINHLGEEFKVDSDVLDAEYDPTRKETQMMVHLRDPEIIHYIETGEISTVSINAGMPRHMDTECNTGECFVVPRGLVLGELDNIAFTWVVSNPQGIMWRGQYITPATPGVKTTKIELL